MKKTSLTAFAKRKAEGKKLVMCTAYDAPMASLAYEAGIDMMLVGDSVGTTSLGYDSTVPVTMDDMLRATAAVRRGAPEAFIVFDMPFMSYQADDAEALRNAARALKECGADAVKLEGGAKYAPLVRKMTSAGIPVMGHIGLLPQSVMLYGTYKVAGRGETGARQVIEDALALQEAGAFCVVLECVPAALAAEVTAALSIPTVGIGAGKECSVQIHVIHDLLGLLKFTPKHARCYAQVGNMIKEALGNYVSEVNSGVFPGEENSFQ